MLQSAKKPSLDLSDGFRIIFECLPKVTVKIEGHLDAAMSHDCHQFLGRPSLLYKQRRGRVAQAVEGVARLLDLFFGLAVEFDVDKAQSTQQRAPTLTV